ncbi:MAG: type II toxin-antitoxin system RelE/ParE family toxin [Rubrivivax sp.]|jgi:plasmid stabilization system protein ParE|nr:type II toxin-antitoxin system RelE/ParE family toxin [Betaproteobacteria bacterium]MBP6319079.1 type II toxin-antitoxin system RelE/ParE family toxin [Rubrivivax sp.]MBK7276488.1 type II toxin-antitoxin system RelE/ParE family toxin [Betaproteobacteria bacterium]MBK7458304.1 type II toxin-antitoxin system RelE/ParE family toxin [Betaproteobacteria bacterium]MBK7517279.1 type II toxin-antitoxin system RelE/ParE family toxin [Betaproteobacteria bacterium]
MRVRWLRKALRNLDDEATYIAADDTAAATVVVKRVLDAVSMLGEQPGLGRPGRVAGTRELIVAKTRYIVPYRVRGNTVEILRVFHTSRRLPGRW